MVTFCSILAVLILKVAVLALKSVLASIVKDKIVCVKPRLSFRFTQGWSLYTLKFTFELTLNAMSPPSLPIS